MSDTPRTDAIQEAFNQRDGMCVDDIVEAYEHARTLERELARWQKIAEQASAEREHNANVAGELRAENARLRESHAAIYLALDTNEADHTKWPGLIADIHAKLAEVERERDQLRKQLEWGALSTALAKAERERDAADQRIRHLETDLAASVRELAEAKATHTLAIGSSDPLTIRRLAADNAALRAALENVIVLADLPDDVMMDVDDYASRVATAMTAARAALGKEESK